jgi:hypothetical protein
MTACNAHQSSVAVCDAAGCSASVPVNTMLCISAKPCVTSVHSLPSPARKRYPEALECLLAALTAPSMVTNAIAVAAFKKWTLVNLIHNGKLPPLPRWTPVAVSRAVKLEGGPYQVVKRLFARFYRDLLCDSVDVLLTTRCMLHLCTVSVHKCCRRSAATTSHLLMSLCMC